MTVVGVVGDLHLPFEHPSYLGFCRDTFKAWGVKKVVFIGDIVDAHAISFHEVDPNGLSAEDEADLAYKKLRYWVKQFPKAKVCIGNHCERHYRKARKHGLPNRYIRSYKEVWGTPKWDWDVSHRIDDVIYTHGTGSSGKDAAFNRAMQSRSSLAMGHTHTYAGVKYHTSKNSRLFGLQVGCGIDPEAYAFAYARDLVTRPVLGCGVVLDGRIGIFEPMLINKGEEYAVD